MKKVNTQSEDRFIDDLLRPASLKDYVGQEKIKKSLKIILGAAKKRNEPSDHLLFYGQPGLGKTTLATIVAKEMGANLRIISGPNLSKIGDLAAILSNLESKDIIFIDEAHRMNRAVEEMLYGAIDNRKINLSVGKGPSSRLIAMDLQPFTLVSATTRINLLSHPLRSRFGATFRIDYYENKEIALIIERSAEILNCRISQSAIEKIVKASRFTPRIANRLLKRARDVAEVKNSNLIDDNIVAETFGMLDIDELGLEFHDRNLLEIIIKKFRGGPVGINALSAASGEEKGVIEAVYEPYLTKIGFLQRTPSGRIATKEAREWMDNN